MQTRDQSTTSRTMRDRLVTAAKFWVLGLALGVGAGTHAQKHLKGTETSMLAADCAQKTYGAGLRNAGAARDAFMDRAGRVFDAATGEGGLSDIFTERAKPRGETLYGVPVEEIRRLPADVTTCSPAGNKALRNWEWTMGLGLLGVAIHLAGTANFLFGDKIKRPKPAPAPRGPAPR